MAVQAWFFYALGASIFWGAGYVISEKILKESAISPAFLMLAMEVITLPLYILLVWQLGHFKMGIEAVTSNWVIPTLIFIGAITVFGGNYLILHSISEKNATLASLVEISYPLFTFLFAWWFLKDIQLSWEAALGGVLIFSGIAVIYLKS